MREGLAAFGEVGLTGRLRAATQAERRLEECRKFGLAVGARAGGDRRSGGRGRDAARALAAGLAENPG